MACAAQRSPRSPCRQKWANGATLVGITPSNSDADADFPHYLVAHWRVPAEMPKTCRVQWEFVPIQTEGCSFAQVSPIGHGVQSHDMARMGVVSDRIVIGHNEKSRDRQGRYRLYVSLLNDQGNPIPLLSADGTEDGTLKCDLGLINVVYSKRMVLAEVAAGKCKDPWLAALVLLDLIN